MSKTLPALESTYSSGVAGLDIITGGGYTSGHATIIRGASGTGKTLFALIFSAATARGQAVVYASFDEPIESLQRYLTHWKVTRKAAFVDFNVDPEVTVSSRSEVDLGAILVRLENALKKSGATVVVLDAIDAIFNTFGDTTSIRRQIRGVFAWCRSRGITVLATAGIGENYLASTSVMDYASDCTILLSQDMQDGLMTRKLRVLKLRGRGHGTNEYPFLIDAAGISVLPVTDMSVEAKVSRRKLSTGIPRLDTMLGGKGIWVGSTVMISGQSGTGKSLFCAKLAERSCREGLRVLYQSFEESPKQFLRDIRSAGIDLKSQVDSRQCLLDGRRPVEFGMEEHVIRILRDIDDFKPDVVLIDPISSLADLGEARAFKNLTLRLCQAIKSRGVTTVLAELLGDSAGDVSSMNISSIVDTWIRLSRVEMDAVMTRRIKIHKSRGAATSAHVNDFEISKRGITIAEERQ